MPPIALGGPTGNGGRRTSSCRNLGGAASGRIGFFVVFRVSFPAPPFFRSSCFISAGADAKAFVAASNMPFAWAGAGAGGAD